MRDKLPGPLVRQSIPSGNTLTLVVKALVIEKSRAHPKSHFVRRGLSSEQGTKAKDRVIDIHLALQFQITEKLLALDLPHTGEKTDGRMHSVRDLFDESHQTGDVAMADATAGIFQLEGRDHLRRIVDGNAQSPLFLAKERAGAALEIMP